MTGIDIQSRLWGYIQFTPAARRAHIRPIWADVGSNPAPRYKEIAGSKRALILISTMFVTYVLYSRKFDKIYIGYTSNLIARFKSHNELGKGWTKRYRPWEVISVEFFGSKKQASYVQVSLVDVTGQRVKEVSGGTPVKGRIIKLCHPLFSWRWIILLLNSCLKRLKKISGNPLHHIIST
ncbi:MAG: GIY-YIG nuclease family protein [Bacteroidales bacterium]